jgi:sterol desaturase/sphingolipid hydroxylase (fatty acid hydroxylase superfamily)
MDKLLLGAIPFFLLFMAVEVLALRHAAHESEEERRAIGYDARDSATSITMGLGHLVIGAGWKVVMVATYAAIHAASPFALPTDAWWTWVLLFLADDLAFYCYHRGHHRVRLFWATHVVHHSSEHYNLSTALRQDWTPFSATLFWVPSALLFPPWMVLLALTWNLLFQFGLHTETVDKLPRPIELLFNTPSHHRVHHGSQEQYLDKNYAGILIVWDRLFGTFQPEAERVRYGLTTNIETHNPARVAFGEFGALWRDVRTAASWRDRLGYVVNGPGWAPGGSVATTAAPAPDEAGQVPGEGAGRRGTAVVRGSGIGSPR